MKFKPTPTTSSGAFNQLHQLDDCYLASLGLADRVPVWRAAVDELLSSNFATTRSL